VGVDVEQQLSELWASIDQLDEQEFRARIDRVAAQLPAADAAFERASALDSTDRPDEAVALYREALDAGLAGLKRRRAVIQLAGALRKLGRADESVALLEAERTRGSDELDDTLNAFLALALVDAGREREARALLGRQLDEGAAVRRQP
jgi:hypothetical protein